MWDSAPHPGAPGAPVLKSRFKCLPGLCFSLCSPQSFRPALSAMRVSGGGACRTEQGHWLCFGVTGPRMAAQEARAAGLCD